MSNTTSSIHPAILKARQQQSQQSSKMSITQTFYLAHKARGKLSSEAARSDHNLRLLVGHANLLDSLMLHLQNAEREQDAWFNAMVRGNASDEEELDTMMDTISEDEEESFGSLPQDYSESESSDDESEDEYELDSEYLTTRPVAYDYTKTVIDVNAIEVDEDEEEADDDGFYSLTRTVSHSSHSPSSPPELIEDFDDSDSESNPPSPPQPTLAAPLFFSEKSRKNKTPSFYDSNSPAEFSDSDYYQSSSIISAF